jgi:3-oxoacyl-(acyl-carrier-protein) synthase
MSLRIAGMGWVTPLGRGIDAVWDRLVAGEEARAESISDGPEGKKYPFFPVPSTALKNLPPHPRLRRASAISRFAAAASLDALEGAISTTLTGNREHAKAFDFDNSDIRREQRINMERIALVFAVSNGGVVYTKRFYRDIAESGVQSASPLLFPETVFNAPASHLAAILGISGASYTLVGDGAVGILAMKMAEDLMMNEALDFCLVVGAEECDWLLCDAYRKWRLLKTQPPIEPFRRPPRGMILSEGAGAILLARDGPIAVDKIHAGTNFSRRKEASESIVRILSDLADERSKILIASANGTFVDLAEETAVLREMSDATIYSLKPALGESVGASAIWQVIVAAQSLRTKRLPRLLHVDPGDAGKISLSSGKETAADAMIVSSCGLNQQVAGLRLSI